MNITLPSLRPLAAASYLVGGKNEVRESLKSVHVRQAHTAVWAESRDGVIVEATDGHRMIQIHVPEGVLSDADEALLYPADDNWASIHAVKNLNHAVTIEDDLLRAGAGVTQMRAQDYEWAYMYPSIDRAMQDKPPPTDKETCSIDVDARYVADLVKVMKALDCKTYGVRLRGKPGEPIWVTLPECHESCAAIRAVIMPIRL